MCEVDVANGEVVDGERHRRDGAARGTDHDRCLGLRKHTGEGGQGEVAGQPRGRVVLEELAERGAEGLDDACQDGGPGPTGIGGSPIEHGLDLCIAETLCEVFEEHPGRIAILVELAVSALRADAIHGAVRVQLEAADRPISSHGRPLGEPFLQPWVDAGRCSSLYEEVKDLVRNDVIAQACDRAEVKLRSEDRRSSGPEAPAWHPGWKPKAKQPIVKSSTEMSVMPAGAV